LCPADLHPARGEGTQANVGARRHRRAEERGLRLIELACDRAQLLVAEPVAVGHQRERIALQRLFGEDIDPEEGHVHAPIVPDPRRTALRLRRVADRARPLGAGR
jgi:hypothetical protein